MTGRTHDLVAFTALSIYVSTQNIPDMSLATAVVAFGANMIGGLAPDIDQSTSSVWQKVRFGRLFSKFISPLFGGHRFISHSILGIILFGFLSDLFLNLISGILLVNMHIVWAAFMIGFISHLASDTFTRDGVPWLFPIPIKFGIPPLRRLRIKTGGIIEKAFVFPGLILINLYLFYAFHEHIIGLLKNIH